MEVNSHLHSGVMLVEAKFSNIYIIFWHQEPYVVLLYMYVPQ